MTTTPSPAPAARRRRLAAALRGTTCCAFALLPLADAAALSIGRVQGAPLLGRALQVAVPVALHPGEQLACVRGELQQPETAPAALAVRIEAAGDGRALLRLSSSALVVEPVVTVKVVVGCQDQLTYSDVLLADPPPAREVLPVLPVPAAAPTSAAAPASVPVARDTEAARAPAAQPQVRAAADPVRRPAARPARPAPTQAEARAATPSARPAPPPPPAEVAANPALPTASKAGPATPPSGSASGVPSAAPKPRLKVDLLELPADQAPALEPTGDRVPPQVSEPQRPEAAAARDGLQSAPDPQAAAAREAAVQAELRKLREQLERQSAQLQALDEERELMRTIAAGMAAALALALGVLLWRRSRAAAGQRRWWQASRPDASATSGLPSSLFPSWAPASAAADSLPAATAAALAAPAGTAPAEERTQVMSAAELADAIRSAAPPAPPQPPDEEPPHPDLDLDFSSLHAGLEPAPSLQPEVVADLDAGEGPLQDPSAAAGPAPQPTPAPHEIDWEAPVLPEIGAAAAEVAAALAPAAAPEAPMLPELDFGDFGAGAATIAATAVEAPAPAAADDNGLDFDLDIDLPASPDAVTRPKA